MQIFQHKVVYFMFNYVIFTLQLHNVGITAEFLYWIMWEAVRQLEQSGSKVA